MRALTPEDPRRIGGYRLLGRLGEGGMGRVYLGRSPRGRTVAVKLVHPELTRDPDFRRRFRREVAAARRVGGEWTAPVLDADTESDTPWVATGYVPGPTLHEVVERHGPLPERTVLALAAGLAHALRAVHARDLIHRDLKPSNVMVTLDGPRVIDFGVVRSADASVATRTGALIGSPGFMSPEQVRGEALTPAGDVFSLGSVLAFAATGRRPFGTADGGLHALLYRIAQEDPDLDGLTGTLRGLVVACLAKDPARRPSLDEVLATAGPADMADWLPPAVVAELGRHAAGLLDLEEPEAPPATEAPPAPPVPSGTLPPRKRSRRLYAGIGAAAVATVVSLAAVCALVVVVVLVAAFVLVGDGWGRGNAADGKRRNEVPGSALGTWEGLVRDSAAGGEWIRRVTVTRGATGERVARIRMLNATTLCDYTGTLVAGGREPRVRVRNVRSLPAGRCGDEADQALPAGGRWSSPNASGTLSRVGGTRVPARAQGRWTGTANGVRRTFELGGGPVDSEAVTVRQSGGGRDCAARALLVSAEDGDAIVFFTTRPVSGDCPVNTMHRIVFRGDSLVWKGLRAEGEAPLHRA
ncbi:serine/threonine-protein kinase [Actinomadura kijaniata]|uniref:serine/threonine-protein kinase n=1 Tax=Actinomadura kijaniata TaxID=46161 RepID=UPI003F1A1F80